jgi:hypothetical protein
LAGDKTLSAIGYENFKTNTEIEIRRVKYLYNIVHQLPEEIAPNIPEFCDIILKRGLNPVASTSDELQISAQFPLPLQSQPSHQRLLLLQLRQVHELSFTASTIRINFSRNLGYRIQGT